jgi:hypothetical protein
MNTNTRRYIVRVRFGGKKSPPVDYKLPSLKSAEAYAQGYSAPWDEIEIIRRADNAVLLRRVKPLRKEKRA